MRLDAAPGEDSERVTDEDERFLGELLSLVNRYLSAKSPDDPYGLN